MSKPAELPPYNPPSKIIPAALMIGALGLLAIVGFGFINAQTTTYHRLPAPGEPGGPAKVTGSVTNISGGAPVVSITAAKTTNYNTPAISCGPLTGGSICYSPVNIPELVSWGAATIGDAAVWNGSKFTAPKNDTYTITAAFTYTANTNSTTKMGGNYLDVWKNGAFYKAMGDKATAGITEGSATMALNSGDTIEIHFSGIRLTSWGSVNQSNGAYIDNSSSATEVASSLIITAASGSSLSALLPVCKVGEFLTTDSSGKASCAAAGYTGSDAANDALFAANPAGVSSAIRKSAITRIKQFFSSTTTMTNITENQIVLDDWMQDPIATRTLLEDPIFSTFFVGDAARYQRLKTAASKSGSTLHWQVVSGPSLFGGNNPDNWIKPNDLQALSVVVVGGGGSGMQAGQFNHYTGGNGEIRVKTFAPGSFPAGNVAIVAGGPSKQSSFGSLVAVAGYDSTGSDATGGCTIDSVGVYNLGGGPLTDSSIDSALWQQANYHYCHVSGSGAMTRPTIVAVNNPSATGYGKGGEGFAGTNQSTTGQPGAVVVYWIAGAATTSTVVSSGGLTNGSTASLASLDLTGTLGVGIAAPASKIHVYGGQPWGSDLSIDASGISGGHRWLLGSIGGGTASAEPDGMFIIKDVSDPAHVGGTDRFTIDTNGNVTITGQLKIAGGSPGIGKVLTSDANGFTSWQSPSSGGVGGEAMYLRSSGNPPACPTAAGWVDAGAGSWYVSASGIQNGGNYTNSISERTCYNPTKVCSVMYLRSSGNPPACPTAAGWTDAGTGSWTVSAAFAGSGGNYTNPMSERACYICK